ncbi:MAG: hypothetical protein JW834_04440 [Candidatus Diapherotrites archaeon]|nr:hypothetical protein [Candidatus Diapherotrites archaeon]
MDAHSVKDILFDVLMQDCGDKSTFKALLHTLSFLEHSPKPRHPIWDGIPYA